MGFLQKIAQLVTGTDTTAAPRQVNFKTATVRDLIRKESKIGAQLFGPIPKGHRREFFCLDEHTWVWYEEWHDPTSKKLQSITTRYEIQTTGVIKVQDGHPYQNVEGQELANLLTAIELYYEQVMRGVYSYDPHTGRPLPKSATIKK